MTGTPTTTSEFNSQYINGKDVIEGIRHNMLRLNSMKEISEFDAIAAVRAAIGDSESLYDIIKGLYTVPSYSLVIQYLSQHLSQKEKKDIFLEADEACCLPHEYYDKEEYFEQQTEWNTAAAHVSMLLLNGDWECYISYISEEPQDITGPGNLFWKARTRSGQNCNLIGHVNEYLEKEEETQRSLDALDQMMAMMAGEWKPKE